MKEGTSGRKEKIAEEEGEAAQPDLGALEGEADCLCLQSVGVERVDGMLSVMGIGISQTSRGQGNRSSFYHLFALSSKGPRPPPFS